MAELQQKKVDRMLHVNGTIGPSMMVQYQFIADDPYCTIKASTPFIRHDLGTLGTLPTDKKIEDVDLKDRPKAFYDYFIYYTKTIFCNDKGEEVDMDLRGKSMNESLVTKDTLVTKDSHPTNYPLGC